MYQKGLFNLGSRVFVTVLVARSLFGGYEHNSWIENSYVLFFVYLPIILYIGIVLDKKFFLCISLVASTIGTLMLIDEFCWEPTLLLFMPLLLSILLTGLIGTMIVNRSFVSVHAKALYNKLTKGRFSKRRSRDNESQIEDILEPLIQVV